MVDAAAEAAGRVADELRARQRQRAECIQPTAVATLIVLEQPAIQPRCANRPRAAALYSGGVAEKLRAAQGQRADRFQPATDVDAAVVLKQSAVERCVADHQQTA